MTWHRRSGNKYGARRITIDTIEFDSILESTRYLELKQMKVPALEVHPRFPIEVNGQRVCVVELDFCYATPDGHVYEDTKGVDTPMSRLKRKMVEAQYGFKVVVIGPKQAHRRRWMPRGKGLKAG